MLARNITITHRRLSPEESLVLHNELKTTPNILGFTAYELRRLRDVQVAEVNGEFAGAALTMDLPGRWTEIAAVYVLPGYRGMGVGERLLNTAWDRAVSRNRQIYMLSRNANIVEWMRSQGMAISKHVIFAPLAVQVWMPFYMASWHRTREAFRKSPQIRKCPTMVQGISKHPKPAVTRKAPN